MEAARDSRSTVNCDSYILRLPNEILLLIFDAVKSESTYSLELALHRLAVVCRRFRDMLVRDLYRVVSLPKHSFQERQRSAMIALLPSHGHHIRRLEASAPVQRRDCEPDDAQVSNLLLSLSRCAKQFTNLRYLQLHLHTSDRTLTIEQQADLIEMFKVLPPRLQELDLVGFLWTGAAKALAVAQQPNLQQLLLDLESIPGAWMAPAKLTANFPALLSIHIPARWCPQTPWFTQAFEGSKLEHIAIGFADIPDISRKERDLHPCSRVWHSSCEWETGLRDLFVASSSSLTNLTISTISFPTFSVVHHLKQVTDITFKYIDFDWDAHLLDHLVGPFATSSITSLRLVRCSGIPPTFAKWFEYTGDSRQFFPALEELEAGLLYTQGDGEDFDDWPEDLPAEEVIPEGGDVWQPEVRRKLEEDCEMLDIDADFDWDWFEGWG
ncbi:hypothetical protein BDZ89DRAFT_1067742 [Hymenopellis radicata]|nr:hypothetical protein BDZ89DRAFT_1067742 [Hymenopellis radicata]